MPFDVFYSTLLESRNYITTVDNEDMAAHMCLKNNQDLSDFQLSLGLGNMFFIEKE